MTRWRRRSGTNCIKRKHSRRSRIGNAAARPAPPLAPWPSTNRPSFASAGKRTCRWSFRGKARLVHRSGEMTEGYYKVDHSGENVYVLDFTSLKAPGKYFISVPLVGRSLPFAIGANVYKTAFEVQAYGLFAQRCGIELGPPYSQWRRIACHKAGLTLTSQLHDEPHEIQKDLARNVVRRALDTTPDPKLDKLNRDPALVAYYPLDGNFKDASGNGHDLTPRRRASVSAPTRKFCPATTRPSGRRGRGGPTGRPARPSPPTPEMAIRSAAGSRRTRKPISMARCSASAAASGANRG